MSQCVSLIPLLVLRPHPSTQCASWLSLPPLGACPDSLYLRASAPFTSASWLPLQVNVRASFPSTCYTSRRTSRLPPRPAARHAVLPSVTIRQDAEFK